MEQENRQKQPRRGKDKEGLAEVMADTFNAWWVLKKMDLPEAISNKHLNLLKAENGLTIWGCRAALICLGYEYDQEGKRWTL